jgi:tetratricopeptide (TPR) repeat protein
VIVLAGIIPLFYAAASHQRALVWRSWHEIVLTAAPYHRDSPRLQSELAVLYVERGDLSQALGHLAKLESLTPDPTAGTTFRRALIYCLAGAPLPPALLTEFDSLPTLDYRPPTIAALRSLNNYLLDGKCPGLDPLRFAAALQKASEGASPHARWEAQFQIAKLYEYLGRSDEAVAHLDQASRILPYRLEPGLIAVKIQLDNLELKQARKTLNALEARDNGAKIGYTRSISLYEQLLDMLERAPEKPAKIQIQ